MTPDELRTLAQQLRRPDGEVGSKVAEAMARGNAAMVARAGKALAVEPSHAVLEIGPGGGELALRIAPALGDAGSYVAVDHAPDMARLTEAKLRTSASVRTVVGAYGLDDFRGQLDAESFDRFVAVNVLYFVEDLDAFFGAAHEHLRHGGQVVLGIRSQSCLEGLPFTQHGFIARSLDTYFRALAASGFDDLEASFAAEAPVSIGGADHPMDSIILRCRKRA